MDKHIPFIVTKCDSDTTKVSTYLFDTYDEATSFIKEEFTKARKALIDDDELSEGEGFQSEFTDEYNFASLYIGNAYDHTVIRWAIGEVEDRRKEK